MFKAQVWYLVETYIPASSGSAEEECRRSHLARNSASAGLLFQPPVCLRDMLLFICSSSLHDSFFRLVNAIELTHCNDLVFILLVVFEESTYLSKAVFWDLQASTILR